MTSLLFKSEQMSLPIDLSSLTPMSKMSDQQFYDFCQTNPDLRIERSANGEIIIMPPAFADTGNCNSRVSGQLLSGLKRMQLEKHLIPVQALLYPMAQPALQMQRGFYPIAGML